MVLVLSVSMAACQQRQPAAPSWAERQQGWAQAEASLRTSAEPLCVQLDHHGAAGDASSAELATAVRGALDELAKSRLTVAQEVQRGVMTPDDAVARITGALAKAERRVEQATSAIHEQAPDDVLDAASAETSP